MIKVNTLLTLAFLSIASCVQKTESPVDPTSATGFFLQNNLCALVKICPPTTDVAPVPGASGVLTLTGIGKTTVTVSWTAATDDKTAQSAIQYQVYYSTKNNITVLADTKANGTAFGSLTANINTQIITGLTPSTTYYFNVLAKDSAGNEVVYVNNNAYTLNDKIVLFRYSSTTAGNVGGRTGADSLCSTSRSGVTIQPTNITCKGVRAFLSFTGDNIVDMPTAYGIDPTNPIVSASNIAISNNWNALATSGTISNSMNAAGVSTITYWTFTTSTGVVSANSCNNGTSSDGFSYQGSYGNQISITNTWITNTAISCGFTYTILCVCY
ncbi:MAG: fibronectin type III domain-containing protein [Leptospiraceae bacterium]|nr:fibronectin type III domain-containing protein [Leptospiraceae bacterium]